MIGWLIEFVAKCHIQQYFNYMYVRLLPLLENVVSNLFFEKTMLDVCFR